MERVIYHWSLNQSMWIHSQDTIDMSESDWIFYKERGPPSLQAHLDLRPHARIGNVEKPRIQASLLVISFSGERTQAFKHGTNDVDSRFPQSARRVHASRDSIGTRYVCV